MKKIQPLIILCLLMANISCNNAKKSADFKRILEFRDEVAADLTDNLLPWWSAKMPDYVNGGFYGRIDFQDSVIADADKGGVLNARILWTFSAAYRVTKDPAYLRLAARAKDYCIEYFIDKEFGGVYYTLDYKGVPKNTDRYIYVHTYFLYAFSEYARATGDKEALETAIALFETLEKNAFCQESNWYFEDFNREWEPQPRIVDRNTQNMALILVTRPPFIEAFTNLYRVWPEAKLAERLRFIVETFVDKIFDPNTNHLHYVIDKDWNSISEVESYGHDIEAAWLLREAALVLGDAQLLKRVEDVSVKIAEAVTKAIQPDGSLLNSTGTGTGNRSWWPQVEAIVGYFDAWEISGDEKFLDIAINCWNYTRDHFIDKTNGGWHSSLTPEGEVRRSDKAANWVCPYHTGRMEMEIMERVERLLHNKK